MAEKSRAALFKSKHIMKSFIELDDNYKKNNEFEISHNSTMPLKPGMEVKTIQ